MSLLKDLQAALTAQKNALMIQGFSTFAPSTTRP